MADFVSSVLITILEKFLFQISYWYYFVETLAANDETPNVKICYWYYLVLLIFPAFSTNAHSECVFFHGAKCAFSLVLGVPATTTQHCLLLYTVCWGEFMAQYLYNKEQCMCVCLSASTLAIFMDQF